MSLITNIESLPLPVQPGSEHFTALALMRHESFNQVWGVSPIPGGCRLIKQNTVQFAQLEPFVEVDGWLLPFSNFPFDSNSETISITQYASFAQYQTWSPQEWVSGDYVPAGDYSIASLSALLEWEFRISQDGFWVKPLTGNPTRLRVETNGGPNVFLDRFPWFDTVEKTGHEIQYANLHTGGFRLVIPGFESSQIAPLIGKPTNKIDGLIELGFLVARNLPIKEILETQAGFGFACVVVDQRKNQFYGSKYPIESNGGSVDFEFRPLPVLGPVHFGE